MLNMFLKKKKIYICSCDFHVYKYTYYIYTLIYIYNYIVYICKYICIYYICLNIYIYMFVCNLSSIPMISFISNLSTRSTHVAIQVLSSPSRRVAWDFASAWSASLRANLMLSSVNCLVVGSGATGTDVFFYFWEGKREGNNNYLKHEIRFCSVLGRRVGWKLCWKQTLNSCLCCHESWPTYSR